MQVAQHESGTSAVDKGADLWAFGVVLYEMLTGTQLFEDATISDTLAHVLTREPSWTTGWA
jgi:serine/threonine-protein kinase